MLPKIPYSMEKNKSMTVPIGNYNISSNFKPGDIADSYGISARRYPQLTNRKKALDGEEILGMTVFQGEILGMTVFQGEIVTVRETEPGEAAVYVGIERVVDVSHNKDIQLVAINSKLVVYPDKTYIEKIDGEWAWGTLYESAIVNNVTFENDKFRFMSASNEISGYGATLSGTKLTLPVRETIDYNENNEKYYQIKQDNETKRTIVTYLGKKYRGTIKRLAEYIYDIQIPGEDVPDVLPDGVYVGFTYHYAGSVINYFGYAEVAGIQSENEGLAMRVAFSEDPGVSDMGCNVYWVRDGGSPFCDIADGTWLEIAGYKDAFNKDEYNELKLIGTSTDSGYVSRLVTSDIVKLAWLSGDLAKIRAGDIIVLAGHEGDVLTAKEVSHFEESTVITLMESANFTLDTLGEVTIKYSSSSGIVLFNNGDAVTISGCENTNNNKTFIVSKTGIGAIHASAEIFEPGTEGQITIERKVPDLDFICERDNRLYGVNNAEKTIYVSALGDPTNMYAYEGVSTDSFAVPVGGEGDFTGCCKYGESVLFFKEDKIYKLTGYTPADFAIDSYDVDGLQAGSDKSPVVINEVLYYKGKNGIFAYTGGIPTLISDNFGEHVFSSAAAGTDGVSYYVSMSEGGKDYLLSYNTRLRLWVREGDERYYHFVRLSDGLYAADDQDAIYKLNASADVSDSEWMVQFVPFYETIEGKKTYSRLLMRAELPRGSYMIIEVRSDDGVWREAGKIVGANKGIIPIRLPIARCDKFELRLRGKGEFTIHDILREYHVGSEV